MTSRMTAATAAFALAAWTMPAIAQDTAAGTMQSSARITSPADGATVTSPITVSFGSEGAAAPGESASSSYHLIIDESQEDFDYSQPVENDERVNDNLASGEVTVELDPGEHTLWLVMGDGSGMLHQPPVVSEPITIYVQQDQG